MSRACVRGSARTPFGSLGGGLREIAALDQAETAARLAIERSGLRPTEIDAVIAAIGLPADGSDLALAAAIATRLELGPRPASTLLGLDAAADALALGHRRAADGETVLVVGAESASRAAYWIAGARLGAGGQTGDVLAIDPLGPALDPLELATSPPYLLEEEAKRRSLTRTDLDAFAGESHLRATVRPSDSGPALADDLAIDHDELVTDDPAPRLAISPPLHSSVLVREGEKLQGGDLTVANCAAPIDGAVGLVLAPEGKGPWLGEPRRVAVEAGTRSSAAAAGAAVLAGAELEIGSVERIALGECSAAQSVIAIDELGADRERVNPLGGSIAFGRPTGGAALLLATEAAAMQEGGSVLLVDEGSTGSGLAALLELS